jgi:hypothetical protein
MALTNNEVDRHAFSEWDGLTPEDVENDLEIVGVTAVEDLL